MNSHGLPPTSRRQTYTAVTKLNYALLAILVECTMCTAGDNTVTVLQSLSREVPAKSPPEESLTIALATTALHGNLLLL